MDRAEFNAMMGIVEPKEKPKRGRKPKGANAETDELTEDTELTGDGGLTEDTEGGE